MSSSKATGLENHPATFIKEGGDIIAQLVTYQYIMNFSPSMDRVPDLMLAWLTPLYKNSKTKVGNYRPITVLNVMFKVVERVFFNQLNEYLGQTPLWIAAQVPSYLISQTLYDLFYSYSRKGVWSGQLHRYGYAWPTEIIWYSKPCCFQKLSA